DERIEGFRRDASPKIVIDHQRRRASTVSEAVHGLQRVRAIRRGLVEIHSEGPLRVVCKRLRPHRLARFRLAEPQDVPARRRFAEEVIEAHHAMDLGTREVQLGGDEGHRAAWDEPQRGLHPVENLQEGPRARAQARYDLENGLPLGWCECCHGLNRTLAAAARPGNRFSGFELFAVAMEPTRRFYDHCAPCAATGWTTSRREPEERIAA